MTQGEQQHSGIASAAVKEPRCQFELAENGVEPSGTSSSSSSFSTASSPSFGQVDIGLNMSQMPHLHRQQQQIHSSNNLEHGGDVRTLLRFVNLASDDIKAALDSSTSATKTNTVLVERDQNLSSDSLLSSSPLSSSSSPKSFPPNIDKIDSSTAFDFRFLGNSVAQSKSEIDESRDFTKTCAVAPVMSAEKLDRDFDTKYRDFDAKSSSFKPDMLIMDVPLKDHLQMSNIQDDLKLNSERSPFDKRGSAGGVHGEGISKPHGLILPFQEDKKDSIPRDNPVPLRKRRLPASFWQEPGKSENHKRQQAPPPLSASALQFPSTLNPMSSTHNFKMPLLSPLTLNHHHNESRLGNNFPEKGGFLYPNSLNNNNDSCCSSMSNLGLSFHHYASNSSLPVTPCLDSLQHRSMALSCGSVCSCHLNNNTANNNYFYEHHNHGMYPRSQGEFSSLLNSAAAAAAAAAASSPTSTLSRWHNHAQSLHNDSRDLCHHTLPRVLKPIATKTMSSYPPRFHPIFT